MWCCWWIVVLIPVHCSTTIAAVSVPRGDTKSAAVLEVAATMGAAHLPKKGLLPAALSVPQRTCQKRVWSGGTGNAAISVSRHRTRAAAVSIPHAIPGPHGALDGGAVLIYIYIYRILQMSCRATIPFLLIHKRAFLACALQGGQEMHGIGADHNMCIRIPFVHV